MSVPVPEPPVRTPNDVVLFEEFSDKDYDRDSFLVNSWDDPDEFCPVCNAYHFACFSLPGIGGPYASP